MHQTPFLFLYINYKIHGAGLVYLDRIDQEVLY